VVIGEITAPHGIRGEVRVRSWSDSPDRFRHLTDCRLIYADGREEACRISGAKRSRNFWVLKLAGVDNRNDAEERRGATLAVPRSRVGPLPPGHFYVFQVVGLRVVSEEGEVIGRVKEVLSLPAHDVYVVDGGAGREILIPAVKAVVTKIAPEEGVLIVKSLPGLWSD